VGRNGIPLKDGELTSILKKTERDGVSGSIFEKKGQINSGQGEWKARRDKTRAS